MTTSGDESDRAFARAFPHTPSGLKRIYFCRHGETELNSLGIPQGGGVDFPLNERVSRSPGWWALFHVKIGSRLILIRVELSISKYVHRAGSKQLA